MPLFMIEFGYTPDVWAGLVKSPENRTETVSRILEDAGATLHNLWYSFGEICSSDQAAGKSSRAVSRSFSRTSSSTGPPVQDHPVHAPTATSVLRHQLSMPFALSSPRSTSTSASSSTTVTATSCTSRQVSASSGTKTSR